MVEHSIDTPRGGNLVRCIVYHHVRDASDVQFLLVIQPQKIVALQNAGILQWVSDDNEKLKCS